VGLVGGIGRIHIMFIGQKAGCFQADILWDVWAGMFMGHQCLRFMLKIRAVGGVLSTFYNNRKWSCN
jgi:hypothetical protein